MRARHARDLPTRAVLDRHPKAELSLRSIATSSPRLITRVRAFHLLGHYPTAETKRLLLGTIADDSAHPKLRAAAITGLRGFDLERDADLRTVVITQLDQTDVRINVSALRLLAGVPSAKAQLERISRLQSKPALVRRTARRVLSK